MNVIAINGSARKDGNTAILMRIVLDELEKEGIETELYQLAGEKINGCTACYKCFEMKNGKCAQDGDCINEIIDKMIKANGILLGSPVYFSDVTANMKALMERTGMVARANNNLYRRKIGASVVAVRRGGAIHTYDTLNHFFGISEMISVGSIYWNVGIGRNIGDVNSDEEGIKTMKVLGQNMAWTIRKLFS